MAIWQYDLYLIPRTKVENLYGEIPSHLDAEVFDEVEWWRGHQLADDVKESINQCSTPNKNALPGCQEWGTHEGNRISMGFDGEDISWIWVRVDVRSEYDSFVNCIIELAKDLDCLLLLNDDLILIHPDQSNVFMNLRSSRASKLFSK